MNRRLASLLPCAALGAAPRLRGCVYVGSRVPELLWAVSQRRLVLCHPFLSASLCHTPSRGFSGAYQGLSGMAAVLALFCVLFVGTASSPLSGIIVTVIVSDRLRRVHAPIGIICGDVQPLPGSPTPIGNSSCRFGQAAETAPCHHRASLQSHGIELDRWREKHF